MGNYCERSGMLFLSTLSLRRATSRGLNKAETIKISIHALLAESDLANMRNSPNNQISIHALLAESDIKNPEAVSKYMIFLSTLSLRRATVGQNRLRQKLAISIHALLAESDQQATYFFWTGGISIHALLAESDPRGGLCYLDNIISIHALLAESDAVHCDTLSALAPISIHALLAESDAHHFPALHDILISIHALLAESDLCWTPKTVTPM